MTNQNDTPSRPFFGDLREALRVYRSNTGLTQRDVAKAIGISGPQVSNFENGTSLPREDALEKLIALVRSPKVIAANELRNVSELLFASSFGDETKLVEALDRLRKVAVLLEDAWSRSGKIK